MFLVCPASFHGTFGGGRPLNATLRGRGIISSIKACGCVSRYRSLVYSALYNMEIVASLRMNPRRQPAAVRTVVKGKEERKRGTEHRDSMKATVLNADDVAIIPPASRWTNFPHPFSREPFPKRFGRRP